MVLGTSRPRHPAKVEKLKPFTFRQFQGLWNPTDNAFNLKTEYLSILTNITRGGDQLLGVRQGYEIYGNAATTSPILSNFQLFPLSNIIHFHSETEYKTVPGQLINITFPGQFSALGIDQNIFTQPLVSLGQNLEDDGNYHQRCLMPQWTTDGAPFNYDPLVVGVTAASTVGSIVDMEFFLNRVVFATDQGYIGAIQPDRQTQIIWSPEIANYVTQVVDNNAGNSINLIAGQALAYFTIPNADNALRIGDVVQLTRINGDPASLGGVTAGTLLNQFIVINAYPAESGHQIVVVRIAAVATETVGVTNCSFKFSLDRGWRGAGIVTHDIFNQELMFANGVDKPISYTDRRVPQCTYLSDPSTGSNFNTPVGQFIAAGTNYTVIAGALDDPAVAHISSTGTNGVYVGDQAPNDATKINVSKIMANATPIITGVKFYKGYLFIGFNTSYAIYQLGEFDGDNNHVPRLIDVIDEFGTISHKSQLAVGKIFFALDRVGAINVQQGVLEETFKPNRISEYISSHIIASVGNISDTNAQVIWSMYDRRLSRYLLFVPTDDAWLCYAYTEQADRGVKGWSLLRGYNFACGCRDNRDRLFGAAGSIVYRIGDEASPILTDAGQAIPFVFEFPWIDFGDLTITKTMRYLTIQALGVGVFTVTTYVDDLYYDYQRIQAELADDPSRVYDEFTTPTTPQGQVRFTAGDTPGYGAGSQPFGGGRRMMDPRLYPWPVKFKLLKIRIEGTSSGGMKFVSVSPSLLHGSIHR